MIVLLTGATHTGKTALAQKILEKYKYPYLSLDHLKMGLIRSGNTGLTPISNDKDLTEYLWPIVCEMIKTAIENKQNLIVEGCYIPFNWKSYFEKKYIDNIRYYCLVMSEEYIINYFDNIKAFASVIENRITNEDYTIDNLISDNTYNLEMCKKYNLNFILIDKEYKIDIKL